MYKRFIKPCFDVIAGLLCLIIFSPIFIIITVLLYFANKGKPFFFQDRPGENEKIFYIIKFKTMNDRKDLSGDLLPNEARITKLGIFLRKTSLDEIPQLINVIKGDMSIVGPRPLRTHYLPYYTNEERIRHSVRPGITGLAQVSGRNSLNWEEKLAIDIDYLKNLSLSNDLKIVARTIIKVMGSRDTVYDSSMLDLDQLRKESLI